ncbi:hypothetical protein UFOVP253_54 [uncultured Caudovirales phage]|uniref:Uncharacterized protein n=1 Tax=uncultured Caudovirales phage TaxID=2100421 RepID=A0A6J5LDF6_9CAUD|nr:hypothetical protein UFOVP253_54 [uncultured Caudovirales phage]
MSLAAAMQITDQDVFQQTVASGVEKIGQLAVTPNGRTFAYSQSGGTLLAGQLTQPAVVTANYVTRTLTTAAAALSNQITIVLGTTATQDAFKGFWLAVTDATGKGQGVYYVNGNTAATAGNSNTTIVSIAGALNVALDTTSVVGLYPNQESAVIQHTASSAIPASGAPVVPITSGNFFWNQIGGFASILSDGAVTKNALAIPSASVAGASTIDTAATVTASIGYAPELTVDTKYSPLVLNVPLTV